MIILLCGRDQCGLNVVSRSQTVTLTVTIWLRETRLNAHSVDPGFNAH